MRLELNLRAQSWETYLRSAVLGSTLRLRQLPLGLAAICTGIGEGYSGRVDRAGNDAWVLGRSRHATGHHVGGGDETRAPQSRVNGELRVDDGRRDGRSRRLGIAVW